MPLLLLFRIGAEGASYRHRRGTADWFGAKTWWTDVGTAFGRKARRPQGSKGRRRKRACWVLLEGVSEEAGAREGEKEGVDTIVLV